MSSQYLDKSFSMASTVVDGFVRNRFKLEMQGGQNAGPGQIVTVNFPEAALLHLPSIRFFFDVTTTSETENSATVYGRLPADASSLIAKLEIYVNGCQIQNGTSEYNTICRILKLSEGSLPRDQSVDRALSNGAITSADAVQNEQLCINEWRGFLGENATEYLPTDLLGNLSLKITWAQPNVLVPKENGVTLGDNLTADGKTAAARLTYSISNMYFTVDSVVPPPALNSAYRERLSQGDIKINYKEYTTFTMGGCGSSFTHRFGASSASIDKVYGVLRDTNYLDTGVKSYDLTDASSEGLGDAHVANAFRFRTYENGDNLRWSWSVNNVQHPQYLAKSLEALADIHYAADKLGPTAQGTLCSDRAWFKEGMGIIPLQLNMNTAMGVGCRSGFNSRGINTQFALKMSGLTTPTAVAATGETADRTSFVVIQSTQVLNVGLGKAVSVDF